MKKRSRKDRGTAPPAAGSAASARVVAAPASTTTGTKARDSWRSFAVRPDGGNTSPSGPGAVAEAELRALAPGCGRRRTERAPLRPHAGPFAAAAQARDIGLHGRYGQAPRAHGLAPCAGDGAGRTARKRPTAHAPDRSTRLTTGRLSHEGHPGIAAIPDDDG
ncbi:hypothetical protein [Streptomyces sp. CA-253872]|uniref:hypothetical protein n=1 Tax=Streptomyces sp. CA-253872 TaxID=3240067 RepID=UPI003D928A6D